MRYLNLSILILVVVMGFEYFMKDLESIGVTPGLLAVIDSTLLVSSGVFMIAFIASLQKIKMEQKYILYLVVLVVISLKALSFIRG